MLPSVTVPGSSALLKVMVTVRPLTVVLVTTGAVVSARVKVIGAGGDEVLAVLGHDDRPGGRALDREGIVAVGHDAGGLGEADREVDDRRVGRVVDRDRGADVDGHARGGGGERQVGGGQGREDDRLVEGDLDDARGRGRRSPRSPDWSTGRVRGRPR